MYIKGVRHLNESECFQELWIFLVCTAHPRVFLIMSLIEFASRGRSSITYIPAELGF